MPVTSNKAELGRPSDILYGAIKLHQPPEGRGPRVSVDTVLLAHFARARAKSRVVEMGCAHGAVTLIMAIRSPSAAFEGFDIDPGLVAMAEENAALNGMSERVSFFASDLREHRKNFKAGVIRHGGDEPALRRAWEQQVQPARGHGARAARRRLYARGRCRVGEIPAAERRQIFHCNAGEPRHGAALASGRHEREAEAPDGRPPET